nr:potassium ABC transporter ATPase [Paraburkholderia hayleyella]
MDLLYVGGLVLFAALSYGLIAACARLRPSRPSPGARS